MLSVRPCRRMPQQPKCERQGLDRGLTLEQPNPTTSETVILLRGVARGEREAADQLTERLHSGLFSIAEARLRGDPLRRSVDPASLVSEVYLRLLGNESIQLNDRLHFLAVASKMMRQALLDIARSAKADKRGGGWGRVTLSGIPASPDPSGTVDMEALERSLNRLAELDPRQARVVELRFFAGMTEEEVAESLGISRRSVQIDWSHAKAWLKRELGKQTGGSHE